jgi:putative flippase GtrA
VFLVQRVKRLLTDPVESFALQVPRALVASILALGIDFSIFVFCIYVVGMPALAAAVIGYLAGGVVQYVLCSLWVFSTSLKNDALGFVAFSILSLVGLGITEVVLLLAHQWSGVHPIPARCAAVGLAFTWNFMSRKFLLFRRDSALTATEEPAREVA